MTRTRGNVIIEEIKVGDIHYEYDLGMGIKVQVDTLPVKKGDQWTWEATHLSSGNKINYLVTEGLTHYGPNLYDYKAYTGEII